MMNVLFAANDVVYSGLELAIYTLLTHNENVNIYVFTMDCTIENPESGCGFRYLGLQDWMKEKLTKIVKYLGKGHSQIIFKDVHEEYMEYLDNSVNRYTGFTPYTALRLLADKVLPHIHHLWYFDCDVAITGNIEGYYYQYCQQNFPYAAYVTPDACDGEGEMVAGVMFMNLDEMRKTNFLATARRNYNNTLYNFPDQCAIRDTAPPVEFPPTLGYCESLLDCKTLPLIIHFTSLVGSKIYTEQRAKFFRRFPFLQYAEEGIKKLDQIHI